MGKAAESTALSMVREVVFGVGFALLLPRFFGLDGVLYSMPMSDILTFLIAGYLICKTYRELSHERRSLMEKRIIMPPTIILHWTAGSSALKKAPRLLKALPEL